MNYQRFLTMNKDLKKRIKEFNDIKFGTYNTDKPVWNTVIIYKTLKPEGTVTTAPIYKE